MARLPFPADRPLAISVFSAFSIWAYGQAPILDPKPTAEIVTAAGSYTLEWRRHYPLLMNSVPEGAADDSGALWLITRSSPGKPEELTKIDPDGQLSASFEPRVPVRPMDRVDYMTPAASGGDITDEGAFFIPMGQGGPNNPVRIANGGPQFPTMISAGADDFIVAAIRNR